jgi:hypothetical protein
MRQVEFLEPVRIGHTQYETGDRKSFDDNEAGEYIRVGWAKCVETGEVGERKPGAQKLQVHNVTQPTG